MTLLRFIAIAALLIALGAALPARAAEPNVPQADAVAAPWSQISEQKKGKDDTPPRPRPKPGPPSGGEDE